MLDWTPREYKLIIQGAQLRENDRLSNMEMLAKVTRPVALLMSPDDSPDEEIHKEIASRRARIENMFKQDNVEEVEADQHKMQRFASIFLSKKGSGE